MVCDSTFIINCLSLCVCVCMYKLTSFLIGVFSLLVHGVTSEGSAVLGLRKFGACSAVSVGRLTLVEGGLVWRLVAGT